MSRNPGTIWIQGAGELASGVAWRLVQCGYRVVMAEVGCPRAVRRLVCFSEAVYNETTQVEGLCGRLYEADRLEFQDDHVSLVVDPKGELVPRLQPAAVVDARLTKKQPVCLAGNPQPLIGLGPGFVCGRDADMIIETHRGARLGEVITAGSAADNTGIPGPLGGETARRLLRTPVAGNLKPRVRIGDLVTENQLIGTVCEQEINTAISGLIRGLVHHKAELSPGEKVGDVDPRGDQVDPAKITDKSLAIGGGVLEALLRLDVLPVKLESR